MQEFEYILDTIKNAPLIAEPFDHLYVEDLLSSEHLNMIISDAQIRLEEQQSTKELIDLLGKTGYEPVSFPGCTTSVENYLKWINKGQIDNLYNKDIVEAFGMAFKLNKIKNQRIQRLLEFLNSDGFHAALEKKFQLVDTRISTTIQKYLTGYEISPHPDVRGKALTYLVNINTSNEIKSKDVHTHLLQFKPDFRKVYDFWQNDQTTDRCWVPWSWCDTKKLINKNNTLVMFAPSNKSLHAIKLDYNHLPYQRTQFYGNLWYNNVKKRKPAYYQHLPI